MVCTPWGPRAVPTGGAGVADPAGSWILTTAVTRLFAISCYLSSSTCPRGALQLGDLAELQLHGRLPPEDVDENLQLELVFVDRGDLPREVGEGPLAHPHRLPLLEL